MTKYTFEETEAALCIWEHVLQGLPAHREAFDWFSGDEGAAQARTNAILIAGHVDAAYERAQNPTNSNGGGDLDEWCFDWEIVPVIVSYFMGRCDGPAEVTDKMATECATFLPGLMEAGQ